MTLAEVSTSITLVHKGLEGSNYLTFLALGSVVTGVVGGFLENVYITLVVLACVPLLILAIGTVAGVLIKGTKASNKAYGAAGSRDCVFQFCEVP